MSDRIAIHILRRADLARGDACYAGWDDPLSIARPTDEKRRAMLANPLAGGDDDPMQLIGLSGKLVIGRMDLLACEVTVGGRGDGTGGATERLFWGSHLAVPPEHRNTLMGVMLVMKAQGLGPTAAAFGPSQAALPLYQKLKWVDLPLSRHIMLVRSRPVVRHYLGGGVKAAAATALADAVLATHRRAIAAWGWARTRGLRVERIASAPAAWDERFAAARPRPVRIHRSAAFINWQLTHSFGPGPRNSNALYVVRDRAGTSVAYFMNKVRFHPTATHRGLRDVLLGSMQDWMALDPAAAEAAGVDERTLLALAVRELLRAGVDAVDFCTADPATRAALPRMGFKSLGHLHLLFKPSRGGPLAGDPRHADLSNWWIRPGDGDNYFI